MRTVTLNRLLVLAAAIFALGLGIYALGRSSGGDEMAAPTPYRFAFLLIPVLALAGGGIAHWTPPLAAILLGIAALVSLGCFGLTLPSLILAGLLAIIAVLLWMDY